MMGVLSSILNKKALTGFVEKYSAVKEFVFLKHPTLLRKYGELRVRRITRTSTSFSFYILTFPPFGKYLIFLLFSLPDWDYCKQLLP